MRKQKAINNIKYNLIFFILNALLSFASKTMFINCLGSEYTGLNSVLRNLIGFMSVAELGIGTAVTYSLYKPLRENNYEKINSILSVYKYLYALISIIILGLSITLSLFIGNIINSKEIHLREIVVYFFIYVIMTISSYLLTYTQIIAVADQKGYIVTKVSGSINIIKVIVQLAILYFFRSYFIWIISEVMFTIFGYWYVKIKIFRLYPWIRIYKDIHIKTLFNENKRIFVDTKNLFLHKIGSIVVFQTDNIVLSTFTTLTIVTQYSNYLMITSILNGIVQQLLNGIRASAGDLVAEGDNKKCYFVWSEIYIIINFIAFILSYCIFININGLIELWVGKEFILGISVVLVISLNLYIQMIRGSIDIFKDGYGLFWDKYSPLVEASVNLIVSVYLVKKVGVVGVVIGTLISNILIIIIWKPYVVFRYGFKMKYINYIKIFIKTLTICIISILITSYFMNLIQLNLNNIFIMFIVKSLLTATISTSSYLIISLLDKNHLKIYIKGVKSIIIKIK